MKLTYTPDGGDSRSWEFKPGKLVHAEAAAIEKLTGWTWAEFGQFLVRGSITAQHALLYVFLKREQPTLKPADLSFTVDAVDLGFDGEELLAMYDAMNASRDLSDDEREGILAGLRGAGLDEALAEREAEDPKGEPNEPSGESET